MVPFSVLDLSNIIQGGTVADALHRSRELARHAEQLGYRRFWLAEHHNMPGIAADPRGRRMWSVVAVRQIR